MAATGGGDVLAPSYGDRGVVSYVIRTDGPDRVVKLADGADPFAVVAEVDRLDWIGWRLPAPRVLASSPLPSGGHAVVLLMPSGTPISDPTHRIEPVATARAIGGALRHIHSLKASSCPFRSDLDVRLRSIRRRLNAGAYDAALFSPAYRHRDPAEVFALLDAHRPEREDGVFTHGRLQPDSVLIDPDGQVSVLDWAHAGVADRYVDLAWTLSWVAELLGPDVTPDLLEAYGAPSPDLIKLDYYALLGQFA